MRKVIIVGVCLPDTLDFNENIEEMKNLAEACEMEVLGVFTQNLRSVHKKTYINSGKCEEIKAAISEEIDAVVFDKELAPSQQRNLEAILQCPVIDKTALILDIFALRAKTKEARLQVEVARLKYALPRLAGSYTSLDRQRGGDRNKGAGETKLELDVRNIESRIHALEKEIKEIAKQRDTQRKKRKKNNMKCATLVGYTNAGKSSLLNAMMDKEEKEEKKVFEEDMLFATLTTNTRHITLPNNTSFLLSDTVGFVSDLPHTLIKAFHSTLEEVLEADLLIQVVDVSNPSYSSHIDVTNKTLQEIGASHIPMVYVYNKCDKTDIAYPHQKDDRLYLCAKQEESISFLLETIQERLFQMQQIKVIIPYEKSALVSLLNEKAQIITQEYNEQGTVIECIAEKEIYEQIKQYGI